MKEKASLLNPTDIEILEREFETLTFPNDFDLVYENQIPSTGVAILEGTVELIKNSKVFAKFDANYLLGLNHLIHETPARYGMRVKANSKVILLGKSQIMNSVKNRRSVLYKMLRAVC